MNKSRAQTAVCPVMIIEMASIEKQTAYPIGLFGLNGNLSDFKTELYFNKLVTDMVKLNLLH